MTPIIDAWFIRTYSPYRYVLVLSTTFDEIVVADLDL